MQHVYTGPVARLLDFGAFDLHHIHEPWPDYLELGFTGEHVPDLIRMTADDSLNGASRESLEVWAPLHAWRTLGQLQAVEAARPLLRLFEKQEYDSWLPTELPKTFSLIGPEVIPILAEFMADEGIDEGARISVPTCLEQIAREHPGCRDECIDILCQQLRSYAINGSGLNAFLVTSLTDLKAVETIEVIREAFLAECVDLFVLGDVEDVEIELGLREFRETPPSLSNPFADLLQTQGRSNGKRTGRPAKVGRNDPCPCGSGKKFKKCCLH